MNVLLKHSYYVNLNVLISNLMTVSRVILLFFLKLNAVSLDAEHLRHCTYTILLMLAIFYS